MQMQARRVSRYSPHLGVALLLLAAIAAQACGARECQDTGTCGTFTPNSGCGWVLSNGTVVWSVDELQALGATQNESEQWALPTGETAEFQCELASPDGGFGGTAGINGNQDSGSSGTANGGTTGGTSGNGAGGQSGTGGNPSAGSGGLAGAAGAGNDGGILCTPCAAPTAQCSPEGECVECTANAHCTSEAAARCDTASYSCEGCTAPSDCTGFASAPNCDTPSGNCVECTANAHCTSEAASLCGAGNTCEPCEVNDDCNHLPDATVCDNGACVECTGTDYDSCGTLEDIPLVCDSLNNTCLPSAEESQEHAAGACQTCVSDAHCQVGQRCAIQQYDDQDVGYFCFWEQGAGGTAPDDCFAESRPFIDELEQQVSIDGVEATLCGLAVSTCVSFNEFRTKNCAPTGTPDDDLCGFMGGDDGYCRHISGPNYRCTMLCGTDDDCKVGFSCDSGLPDVCEL